MENIKKSKQELRKEIVNKRRQLTASYIRDANRRIADQIIELPEFKIAETIFCFVSTDGEIDTFPILNKILEEGKNLVVPKCISPGIMSAFYIEGLHKLSTGAYGILEPKEGCRLAVPDEIDFAIIPCISCDLNGRRLGHGVGYYDRYLKNRNYQTVVICHEKLMKKEIPWEPWDLMMDLVVTEERVVRVVNR